MLKSTNGILAVMAILLAACSAQEEDTAGVAEGPAVSVLAETEDDDDDPPAPWLPAVDVPTVRETQPVASMDDAADDPAIWLHPDDPARSLIVGTDKEAGLNVYALDGSLRSFFAAGRVNNVDLRGGVNIGGMEGIVVAASDRNDLANGIMVLYRLDPANAELIELAKIPGQVAEAYGICLYRAGDGALYGFLNDTNGKVSQFAIDLSGPAAVAELVRTLSVATQPEGCVADDRTGMLYIGEEGAGIWRFDAAPDGDITAEPFASVDNANLVADVEGLAIVPEGDTGGYLVASSQGDSAFVVYDLESGAPLGRFRIAVTGAIDGTDETDGIEFHSGNFGPDYPNGLFIAQDGDNTPDNQNFKFVSWDAVRAALILQ